MSDNENHEEILNAVKDLAVHQAIIIEKVDKLEKQFDKVAADLDKKFDSLNNTVRGHNGTPGLVAQVATIQTKLDMVLEVHSGKGNNPPKQDKDKVTWSVIVEKVVLPIGVAFALWLLLTVLPKLLLTLGEL